MEEASVESAQRLHVQEPSHGTQASLANVSLPLASCAERELRAALVQQTRSPVGMYAEPTRADLAALHGAITAICAEAHRLDLRAEQLLVAIKQAWSQLAPMRARHLGERDGEVLRGLVTSSIEEFFAVRP